MCVSLASYILMFHLSNPVIPAEVAGLLALFSLSCRKRDQPQTSTCCYSAITCRELVYMSEPGKIFSYISKDNGGSDLTPLVASESLGSNMSHTWLNRENCFLAWKSNFFLHLLHMV
ncbi:UNVERIFIED_CONTAM: hypothetical protein K2H54_057376 [Gekko kuhli]